MSAKNLQELLDASGNPVELLRNVPLGRFVYPVVPEEFSNWNREQAALRKSAVLYDLTHHMSNLFMEGPDLLRLISDTAINTVSGFEPGRGKQYVAVTPDGYVIGDGILFYTAPNEMAYVGRIPAANWLRFHIDTGDYDVTYRYDLPDPQPYGKAVTREVFRFQIQGPNAGQVLEALNGGPYEAPKFFRMGYLPVAGNQVRVLRHGMGGTVGLELWGPYENHRAVRDAVLEAGAEFGIEPVGSRAYSTVALESGWIPSPLPAIYTGDGIMRKYREWLPANGYESRNAISGSYVPESIEGYYTTPYDLGYGQFIKYDHDFIGADALKAMNPDEQRKKVTFAWNAEDVAKIFAAMFDPEADLYHAFNLSNANYGASGFDRVIDSKGDLVGLSMYAGYSTNERRALSLGVVANDVEIGEELRLVWGEPDGGTKKLTVEPHKQLSVRVTVSQAPYTVAVRDAYGASGGWRSRAK